MSEFFSKGYTEYIKSPRWKAVCYRYWLTYGKKCQACGARDKLQVHHKDYARFGRETLTDLTGLCNTCHQEVHRRHRRDRRMSLRLVTDSYVREKRRK